MGFCPFSNVDMSCQKCCALAVRTDDESGYKCAFVILAEKAQKEAEEDD